MRYLYVVLIAFICSVTGYSQSGSWQGVSVDFLKGRLEVSKNGRYLQHKNGIPFFYLADTAWELFHRLNEKEIEEYLEDRRAKGFTVIQAAILAELDGLYAPDANGQLPLKDIDNVIPNETYFKWVDKVIRIAESKGLYIGLLPTWGDKVDKQEGTGPEIFNPAHARTYGAWLGKRYKNVWNIIWINGGDRWGGDSNFAIWDNIGKGIKSTDKNHLMTFLPPNEHSSSRWFHNNVWLDFNMIQTGNCQRDYEIYETLLIKDYERYPTKPCLDGKPRYENYPVCRKAETGEWFDDTDIRQAMYWSLFSGSFGHTYGSHDIWQMATPGREPADQARGDWKSSLHLPGATQVIHARRLMEKYDWESRKPAQDMIVSDNDNFADKIVAIKGEGFAFIYFPTGEEATIDFSTVSRTSEVNLQWMNPRTGEWTDAGKVARENSQTITPPSSGRGNDWILIVE
ncbi:MAG: glycoside hydrolase family 140 protein [Tannerellaceae bacterium]|nr:glycoside hydrolase family 140 protein [Tannerellaceae bacterium]